MTFLATEQACKKEQYSLPKQYDYAKLKKHSLKNEIHYFRTFSQYWFRMPGHHKYCRDKKKPRSFMTHAIRATLQNALLIMAIVLAPPAAMAGTITLATHELYPYGYHDSTNNFTGYAVERVRFAISRCGFTLRLLVLPWPRAQALAKAGSVDGFFAGSLSEERKQLFVASTVLAPQNWSWYLLRDTPLTPDSPSFKKEAKVGSFIGANMLTYLERNGFNIAGTPKDTEALFHMLLGKRLDAILANELVAQKVIEDQGIEPLVRSQTLKDEPLHALFTQRFIRENPNFLENFNAALADYEALHHTNR